MRRCGEDLQNLYKRALSKDRRALAREAAKRRQVPSIPSVITDNLCATCLYWNQLPDIDALLAVSAVSD